MRRNPVQALIMSHANEITHNTLSGYHLSLWSLRTPGSNVFRHKGTEEGTESGGGLSSSGFRK